ncbi:AAA family ATPase [Polymorphum gilvum]|uniref:Aminoglycoside phosphotransferase n=1 Tax=Polymorphum gilvum (strain LMG 25793 / CGMCC 1.9160 / SL003B-26A1) TaxID=991905 RepID=F2J0Y1_POLGS|nr:AAA family ATPase [Polymorphum gilvum]ADZ71927.1 Aminoglycoside phosphotransferase [Polymorphum gilvum SL003B-26A1]
MNDSQERVFSFLETPAPEGGADGKAVRIDTHANAVFLSGDTALKVKRAVKFPFLDYSTLEKRRDACEREIACNARFAPGLYLGVVGITETANGRLALDGDGPAIEYAVRMRRFDETRTLDRIAEAGPFDDTLTDALARMMVAAHEAAPRRESGPWIADLAAYVEQNDAALHGAAELFAPARVRQLTAAARAWLARIKDLIEARGRLGLVRLCHGDAHLRNVALIDGRPVLFDAIEFDDAIATGDVLYDLAFPIMDLWERGQQRAANRLFNRYFDFARREADGDALAALPFYLSMRATIRAKIAAASAAQQQDEAHRQAEQAQARAYFDLALAALEPDTPQLVAIGGLSGTGKTTLANGLAPTLGRVPGARVLRSDIERKARLDLAETDKAPPEAYSQTASDAVYQVLHELADRALAGGHSVVLDAVHAKQAERAAARATAARSEADFLGLWLEAGAATLKARVETRRGDASDANAAVVEIQLGYDPGPIDWVRIDASDGPEKTLERALAALSEPAGAGSRGNGDADGNG